MVTAQSGPPCGTTPFNQAQPRSWWSGEPTYAKVLPQVGGDNLHFVHRLLRAEGGRRGGPPPGLLVLAADRAAAQ